MKLDNKIIAVVILNWNGKKFLDKFLPTVIKYSNAKNVDIWVADNGSTDKSVDFLKNNFKTVKIIELNKNYGFAGGYNKALEKINADYFILLNSDVEVTENWIFPIIEYMEKNIDVAAVQPKILAYNDKKKFEHAGAAGGFIDKFGFPFCKGRILNFFEKDNGQYNKISEIFWATGACFFIKKNDFVDNKFDADFFAHMEEIDLCWRLKNKGRKIMYFPDSKVYHVGGGTLPQNSPKKLFLNYRNNLLLLYKNLHSKILLKIMVIRLLFDIASANIFLLKLQFSLFFSVFKAHLSFFRNIFYFKNKRKKLLKYNKLNHKEIYNKSIVCVFFLRKKRKFTQLNFKTNEDVR